MCESFRDRLSMSCYTRGSMPLCLSSSFMPRHIALAKLGGYTWHAFALPPIGCTCLCPPRHVLDNWSLKYSELVENPVGFLTSPTPPSSLLSILNLHMCAFTLLILSYHFWNLQNACIRRMPAQEESASISLDSVRFYCKQHVAHSLFPEMHSTWKFPFWPYSTLGELRRPYTSDCR